MKSIPLLGALLLGFALAGIAGLVGFQMGKTDAPEVATAPPEVVKEAPKVIAKPTLNPEPTAVSDDDIEELLSDLDEPARREDWPSNMSEEDIAKMEARRERWENMSREQRQMMRKSIFAALSKVEGLEEVGDAIREGRLDPKEFKIDPNSIADRMEFFADTMDQQSMEEEATSTLQSIVDQARGKSSE